MNMINIKNLIEIYDWLSQQESEVPRGYANTLEEMIFNDLIYREKVCQADGRAGSASVDSIRA